MKNVIQLLSIALIISLPFLSTAQFSVGILTAPMSKITTTRVLVPIGVELNFTPTTSIVLEYGIPVYNRKVYQYNEKSYNYSVEFRKYTPFFAKRGLKQYYASKFSHTAESYSLGPRYYIENGSRYSFDYAEMNKQINSFSVRTGLQKVFKNKIILDFNIGLRLTTKSVIYKNILNRTSPVPYVPSKYEQPDKNAETSTSIGVPVSIRVGYLISR